MKKEKEFTNEELEALATLFFTSEQDEMIFKYYEETVC